ncbi:MAG: hypothetical protein KDD01_25720, partial [Phaeodactylibacter sp.]|nr:hypothetical protein [Phaeodactylibacter sp.]
MVKEAYILGNAGLAFFKQEEKWFALDSGALDSPRECHPLDLNSALLSNSEVVQFQNEKPLEEIKQSLKTETERQEALTAALQFIDSSIKRNSTKQLIAGYLNELIAKPETFKFLENRLWSTPMPSVFLPSTGVEIAKGLGFARLAQLYQNLEEAREAISIFDVCWKKVTLRTNYLKSAHIERAAHLLADNGYTKQFVKSIHHRNRKQWDDAVLNATLLLQEKKLLKSAMLFRKIDEELQRTYSISLVRNPEEDTAIGPNTSAEIDEIEELINQYLDRHSRQKRNKPYRKSHPSKRGKRKQNRKLEYKDIEKVLGNVDYFITRILSALNQSDELTADSYLEQLLKSQISTSTPEQICKSLCKVAEQTMSSGFHVSYSRQLLQYARQLNSKDPVIYCQEAEILKKEGNLQEAKEEYQQIKQRFPNYVFALNGYAEVLKAEGNLQEAKQEYLLIKQRFSKNVVALTGNTEVLKAEGNLQEA